MIHTIRKNAELMRQLHSRVHETVKTRSRSEEDLNEWKNACEEFHSKYDQLAFPGGLEEGIKRIKEGDLTTIQTALTYLENTPYCFRSQYVAKEVKRALNKIDLSDRLADRFTTYKSSNGSSQSH